MNRASAIQQIEEICGQSGGYPHIDGWETSLCAKHFEASAAQQKHKSSFP